MSRMLFLGGDSSSLPLDGQEKMKGRMADLVSKKKKKKKAQGLAPSFLISNFWYLFLSAKAPMGMGTKNLHHEIDLLTLVYCRMFRPG